MNFIQPSIDPVILSIGFIEIRWYSLAYILGFLLGIYIIKRLNTIYGNQYSNKNIDSFLIWAVLGVIIGGRTGYVIFYQLNEFLTNPFYLFEIWNGGMSFHGGASGVILAITFYSLAKKISLLQLGDIICSVVPIGLFFGRVANYINSELWGKVTTVSWGVIFPNAGNLARHPSQLYEAILEGLVIFILLFTRFVNGSWICFRWFLDDLFMTFR